MTNYILFFLKRCLNTTDISQIIVFYVSYAHKEKDVKKYIFFCEKVFKKISKAIKDKKIDLKGKARSMAFKRLN